MSRKDDENVNSVDDAGLESPAATPSFRYSAMNLLADVHETSRSSTSKSSGVRNSETTSDVFIRGSLLDRNIEAVALVKGATERHKDYKGRIRVC